MKRCGRGWILIAVGIGVLLAVLLPLGAALVLIGLLFICCGRMCR